LKNITKNYLPSVNPFQQSLYIFIDYRSFLHMSFYSNFSVLLYNNTLSLSSRASLRIVPSSYNIAEKRKEKNATCFMGHYPINYCSYTFKRSKIKSGKPLHAVASALENRILNARHLIVTQWRLLIYSGKTPIRDLSIFHFSIFLNQ